MNVSPVAVATVATCVIVFGTGQDPVFASMPMRWL